MMIACVCGKASAVLLPNFANEALCNNDTMGLHDTKKRQILESRSLGWTVLV